MMPVKRRCDHCGEYKLFSKTNDTCNDCLNEILTKQSKIHSKQIADHRIIDFIRSHNAVRRAQVIDELHITDYEWKTFIKSYASRLINCGGKWSVKREPQPIKYKHHRKYLDVPIAFDGDTIDAGATLANAAKLIYNFKMGIK